LKKRTKKIYDSRLALSGKAAAKTIEGFLLLFFEKEVLLSCLLRASWATDRGSYLFLRKADLSS
jgi:hypothetical protein